MYAYQGMTRRAHRTRAYGSVFLDKNINGKSPNGPFVSIARAEKVPVAMPFKPGLTCVRLAINDRTRNSINNESRSADRSVWVENIPPGLLTNKWSVVMSIAQLTMPAISPHHHRAAHTVNIINSNPEAALTLLIAVIEL